MNFMIYPAIDLKGGKCVRLYQGDYSKETIYGEPVEIANKWKEAGAEWLHIVDLDGAKAGNPVQSEVIKDIVKRVDIPVQVGGGIRTIEAIEEYLNMGVKRVILGTAALKDRELIKRALSIDPSAIAVGMDTREGYVATHGWLETSQVSAIELAKELRILGVRTFIFTDISKDGTLAGPNIEATKAFALETKAEVIASGGVSSQKDIRSLKELESVGVKGVIVGKALYNGSVNLAKTLAES